MKLPKLQAALRSAKAAWNTATQRLEKATSASASAKERVHELKVCLKGIRKELKLARKGADLLATQKKTARKLFERAAQATGSLEKRLDKMARKLAQSDKKAKKGSARPAVEGKAAASRPASVRRRAARLKVAASSSSAPTAPTPMKAVEAAASQN